MCNEKNATLCLQPESTAMTNVRVLPKRCTGDRNQTWQIIAEQTDHTDAGRTGWWSLRPTPEPRAGRRALPVGGSYSEIRLFRASNSADRLWHHQPAAQLVTPGRGT
ncbi:hypothetical protein ACIBBD_27705 [Streptomyces sp. NPDC051315]|uniref:hypothetical protein n=1 Tax=Streptomyces sp. NPDC051315 TaxID=3365650 RepID=UPI0037A59246